MLPIASAAVAALFLASAQAHFTLDYPATIGFDDDLESTGPCGSFVPDFAKDNVTDFHVGGDTIALNLLHPQGNWLFRATLGQSADAANWTQLFPQVMQTGLGKFCEPAVTAPAAWAGSKGVLGVVVDGPDGILFQCAAVNFVAGAATTKQATCTNATTVSAAFTNDGALDALIGGTTASASTSPAATAAPTSTPTKSAAPGRVAGSLPLGSALAAVAMAVMGSAYLLL